MRPRLFVELCAGTGALSLALQGGPFCRPPVSRMGAKTGYARPILHAMGLNIGRGADAILLVEPDPGMASVLRCYPQPERLRAVADIIRGWKDEEPRALWERLRAEKAGEGDREVARFLALQGGCYGGYIISEKPPTPDYNRWPGGSHPGRWPQDIADRLADCSSVDWPPTLIHEGPAEDVEPREVASWLMRALWSYEQGNVKKGFCGPGDRRQDTSAAAAAAAALAEVRWPPTSVYQGPCEDIEPPGLEGVVAYLDGPYHGDGSRKITGYAHEFPREAQLAVARKWSEAGAVVAVSECVPLADELGEGWHAVEITNERKGQKRSFSRAQAEFLTLNRLPAWKPSVQGGLFDSLTPKPG